MLEEKKEESKLPVNEINFDFKETRSNSKEESIAEKLGFINFNEDEYETPAYLRRGGRGEKVDKNITIEKNYDS